MKRVLLVLSILLVFLWSVVDAKTSNPETTKTDSSTLDTQPELTSVKGSNEAFKRVIVYKDPGRFCGWPATHGMWDWVGAWCLPS